MWGPGFPVATNPSAWTTIDGPATSTGTVTSFATIDLNAVRTALANYVPAADPGGPVFSTTSLNPFQQQFTVQLEVSAKDAQGHAFMTGIDRRVFTTFSDPTLRTGYPKRMGTGGEAPVRYADLNGDNVPELIVPTEDGTVHAYGPNGSELAGWPVHTQEQVSAQGHESSAAVSAIGPPLEPPRAPVIADLEGTGKPDVITAAGTHVYAWHGDGTPVAGFPVSSNMSFCGPGLETQQTTSNGPSSHPKCGFAATPAVAHLEGYDKPLDIVAPSLDGHLYAFRADGTAVPGYPLALVDPTQAAAHTAMIAESINEPAIGNLTSDPQHPHDDIVVATNEEYGAPATGSDVSFGGALAGAAGGSARLYAVNGLTAKFLPGWPISLPGAIQNVLPLVGPGHDAAIANIQTQNGIKTLIIASETGGDLATYDVTGTKVRTMQQQTYGAGSNAKGSVDNGGLNLFESASVGDLLGSGTPDVVKYQVSLNQAANLLLVGQNAPYYHLIGAFDGNTGAPLPTWPTITDDYQFLSASDIAQVTPGQTQQVITGTGLGLLHAYDGATGLDVSGFPKVTGGWLFAPAAFSDDGRMADITREGYLFEWQANQPPCQTEWPSYRHDPNSSANYNHDGTPPASPAPLTLSALGANTYHLSFKSPGDDGFCRTAHNYLAQADGQPLDLGAPVAGGSTFAKDITLPAGAHTVTVQARDAAGNLGFPAPVAVPTPTPGGRASGGSPPSGPAGPGALVGPGPGGLNVGPSLGLPPTAACVNRKRFIIHLHAPPGARLRYAHLYVNGVRVRAVRGRRARRRIVLRGLPKGQFTVQIIARTRDGRLIRSIRTYHTCVPGSSSRRVRSVERAHSTQNGHRHA
jgi:hypothetical protein